MVWTTVALVKELIERDRSSGLVVNTYTDAEITRFIQRAQIEITSLLQQRVIREQVKYVDQTRKNSIDGLNTTFYTQKWKGNYLGDLNYDFSINTSDISIFQVASDGTETQIPAATIVPARSSFTLSTAPANVTLYIDYANSPVDMVTPDQVLVQACTYLAAYYASLGEDEGGIRFGNVHIGGGKMSVRAQFYNKYKELIGQIQETVTGGAIWGESFVRI